ncbi:hypothetical protein JL108_18145 [Aeromicrobium sp. YIM 150415]|uniref:hypothetical protein n=1 Tax=Aeromicrobium sp. YIM 150415 TaxID=2803912 RepID=UPI00196643C3|nr:hypothetical protein [Aeromicrobium sp. YIM 150415]MBM9465376.1 hypothetical protein [Aeromicrobium sp. YIM 150415]
MESSTTRTRPVRPGTHWRAAWPAALGVVVAAGTTYGVTDGRELAAVVAASGVVYLAAAATGRRWAGWAAFGVTFVLIGLDTAVGLDATPWLLAFAAVLVLVGIAGRRRRPLWSLPLQTAAMLVLATAALVATRLDAVAGGLVVAAALLGHAGWDVHHRRTGRVVNRSLAEFCAVLDVIVAVVVAYVALAG